MILNRRTNTTTNKKTKEVPLLSPFGGKGRKNKRVHWTTKKREAFSFKYKIVPLVVRPQ